MSKEFDEAKLHIKHQAGLSCKVQICCPEMSVILVEIPDYAAFSNNFNSF